MYRKHVVYFVSRTYTVSGPHCIQDISYANSRWRCAAQEADGEDSESGSNISCSLSQSARPDWRDPGGELIVTGR